MTGVRNPNEVPAWPDGQDVAGSEAELAKAKIAETATRRGLFIEADKASHTAVEAAQIEVIKGTIDRSRDSAKTVQTAATALAGLYTGLAGFVFGVKDGAAPLPLRGVIPVILLGLAIVWSTVYLAWHGPRRQVRPFPTAIDPMEIRVERVKWFNDWASLGVLSKSWALRLAAICLAGGLVFLPAAFVPVGGGGPATGGEASDVAWPEPYGAKQEEILFQAQVDEAAAQRAADEDPVQGGWTPPEWWIWVAFLTFLVVSHVWVGVQASRGGLHRALDDLTWTPDGSDGQVSAVPSAPEDPTEDGPDGGSGGGSGGGGSGGGRSGGGPRGMTIALSPR